jgi:hypothetical protein
VKSATSNTRAALTVTEAPCRETFAEQSATCLARLLVVLSRIEARIETRSSIDNGAPLGASYRGRDITLNTALEEDAGSW